MAALQDGGKAGFEAGEAQESREESSGASWAGSVREIVAVEPRNLLRTRAQAGRRRIVSEGE